MSRVVFMCGPSGAGKSTYARRLESEGMVRLSFDMEMWRRGILRRVQPRRGSHSDDFVLPDELVAQYFDQFEAPTPDEGPLTVVR
ncbi:AAA family ATPase [Nocardioides sp.]|uniref:AAA family ATPase n=1 Tax=Nocardioides sp. TaxID=35761 RepID=UPI002ED1D840